MSLSALYGLTPRPEKQPARLQQVQGVRQVSEAVRRSPEENK